MIEIEEIDKTLPKIKTGLRKYMALMAMTSLPNYYNDAVFRRAFNHFYRMRRNMDFQNVFFPLFSNTSIDFGTALKQIHKVTGRVEASFASKLIATLDPARPVLDQHVLHNAQIVLPKSNHPRRIENLIECYSELETRSHQFLGSSNGKYLLNQFNKFYPEASSLHSMKKLDLLLWQNRD